MTPSAVSLMQRASSADHEQPRVPLDTVIDALEQQDCSPRRSGDEWSAKCPAHQDDNPSLSIGTGADGRVLVHCFAGCPTEAITAALGLCDRDLFPASTSTNRRRVINGTCNYVDASGEPQYQVVRYEPKGFRQRRPDGQNGWIWDLKGVERVPYRLPQLLEGIARGDWIFVVEGEKDVHCLLGMDLVATCNSGGAVASLPPNFAQSFTGARVAILPDNDQPGRDHAAKVASSLQSYASEVRIVNLPSLRDKEDVSDWSVRGGTAKELEHLVAEALPWTSALSSLATGAPDGEQHEPEPAWPEIVRLTASEPVDDFPIEELPDRVRAMVEAVAASTATPVDFPAGVALGAIAAIASRAVSIRPTGDTWTVPANLYYCAVLPSGEGKTPVHRELFGPLREIEREWQEEAREEIISAQTRKTIADNAAEKATRDAGRGTGSEADAIRLTQEANAILVPPTPRLLTTEPTPEAVLRICGDIGGTLAIVNDEGAEVFQLTSRYSASGAANLGVYLAGFDGGPHTSDRVSRESPTIPRLTLSLVLAIQPSVLDELAREKANQDRGLLARFCSACPSRRSGRDRLAVPRFPERYERTGLDCYAGSRARSRVGRSLSFSRLMTRLKRPGGPLASPSSPAWTRIWETFDIVATGARRLRPTSFVLPLCSTSDLSNRWRVL